jgi:hypothetical protein
LNQNSNLETAHSGVVFLRILNLNSPLLTAGMNLKLDHPQQIAWRKPKIGAEIPKYPVACCRVFRNFIALLLYYYHREKEQGQ